MNHTCIKKKKKKRHNREGTSVILIIQGCFLSEIVPSFTGSEVGWCRTEETTEKSKALLALPEPVLWLGCDLPL